MFISTHLVELIGGLLTTGVVAGSEENSTGGLSLPDDVAGCRCAENAIAAHEDLLHAVRGSNLGDQLDDLGVVVTAVTANDEEGIFGAFGNGLEEGGDEVLGVVLLLEDLDLLAEAGAVRGDTSVVALERELELWSSTHVP